MRIAVVTGQPADPRSGAAQARACHLVHALLEQGHRVTLAGLTGGQADPSPFVRGLADVYPALRLAGPAEAIPTADLGEYRAVILTDLWLEPHLEAARAVVAALPPDPIVVLDTSDCLAATFAGVWPGDRVARVAALEAALRAVARVSVFVSRAEALKARRLCPGLRPGGVAVVPTCHPAVGPGRPFADRRHVCLVGSANPNNVAAAGFFLERVWPRLAGLVPNAEFHLVGAVAGQIRVDGPAELIRRVRLVGPVDDLAAAVGGYRVSVAPLLGGSGVKAKVLDSLACGTPVVATAAGAEGLPLVHGLSAVLAPADAGFADAVAGVYRDASLWGQLSREGRRVAGRFGVRGFRRRVQRLVERIQAAERA